ncbi:flagellar motor protein PomA, partial [Vibrio parahaemolyticus]|nr:flagellar motor protein PomA [Vibrio parahaemolyticus]
MDLATLIGLIGGFAFVIMAMVLGGSIGMFVDVTSILIVVGGSAFVVLMKFTLGQFFGAAKIAGKAFMFKADEPEDLIAKIVEMADAARKGGFLALEEMEINNSFMQKGIDLLVDGHDADVVRAALQKDIALTDERHTQGTGV